jgi:hypothetical protein
MIVRLSELLQEVIMPIRVIATGRVTEGPTCVDREDAETVVFVLDPFPRPVDAGVAHACEVVCRGHELATAVLKGVQRGEPVAVEGELLMQRIQAPLEDDLTGVRAWIVAKVVRPGVDST